MSNNIKNQSAERTLSVIATIFLILGVALGLLTIIGGLVSYSELNSVSKSMAGYGGYHEDSVVLLSSAISSIIAGVIVIIASIFQWAIIKVFVNISHNTASLDSRLEKIENKLLQ